MNGNQHSLGVTDPDDHRAALAALKALIKTLEKPEPPGRGTVAEAVAGYLAGPASRSAATHRGALDYAKKLVARFGTESVSGLSEAEVQRWATGLPGLAPDSVRNLLMVAEAVLRYAGRAVKFQKPPRSSRGSEALIPEKVYHQAVGSAWGDLRPLLGVLWETGARPSEIRQLTAEQVDWAAGQAVLVNHKTAHRTKKKRLIPLSTEALRLLNEQREKHGTGPLFRSQSGRVFTLPGLTQAVWRVGKRIGHPGLTAYGFRHTLATRALAAGCPDAHVAAVLGHTSTAMVNMHYSHINQDARLMRDVVDRLSKGKKAA